jgi:ABC-type glutathione transport system ATPase component
MRPVFADPVQVHEPFPTLMPQNDSSGSRGAHRAQAGRDPASVSQPAAISFLDVSKRFMRPDGDALEVLRDVSFDVPAGQMVAILGPSGTGKSTLLNLAAGLIVPDRGRVIIMGRDVMGLDVMARDLGPAVDWSKVGYMFQDDRLLPWRVALNNVALALEAGSMPANERRHRAAAGLALVGLPTSHKLIHMSCPAACAAAWRWRGASSSSRSCCSWMSRFPSSMRKHERLCTTSSSAFTPYAGCRSCSSRTTSRRR